MRLIMATLAAWTLAAAAQAQSVTLTGLDGQSRTVTAADLAAMPRETLSLRTEAGKQIRYEGVPLTLLLQSVGAPAGKALRGPALDDIVVVAAKDGYHVALALADTDAGMRAEKVLLADRADGAPLSAQDGPFRLVVEGDLRGARSARMVTSIIVERAPAP